jgi:peptidoglycan/xylan/chitin deacetylase (PgdA/CDA1 family)
MRRAVAIMFHTVGMRRMRWVYPYISDPLDTFESFMAVLHKRGYTSVFFKDHVPGSPRNHKEVVLTFDDGYLDNWVHVLPILQKYGLKGTVFVNPEFADPRDIVRPSVDPASVSDDTHHAVACCAGFLSWKEMREMEATGLMDVQSHSLSHTWYFQGPRIVDFWHPGAATEESGPVWMLWNRFPESKPFYLTQAAECERRIPYGTPIYEHGKALVTRRYYPDRALDQILPEFVDKRGGIRFFENPNWREELQRIATEPTSGRTAGRLEAEGDYVNRVRHELSESKRIIEERLGKQVNSICWPGGGVSEQVLALAREIGYERFTLPSAWRAARAQGQYADLCPRTGGGGVIRHNNRDIARLSPTEFIWRVERMSGSRFYNFMNKCSVLGRLVQRRVALLSTASGQ